MNPISFPCTHCSQNITVSPDAAGRAVPCPHCKQAILVPNAAPGRSAPTPVKVRAAGEGDQGPDFTETLRKAREATDSIFHDQDDEGDSLFGGSDTPRKLFVPPPIAMPSQTPTVLSDPSQPTLRVPGLSILPPIASATPPTSRAVFVPSASVRHSAASANPFEDLSIDSSPDASGDIQPSGAMVDDEVESEEKVARPFPWKSALIAGLMIYALAVTVLAAWGWLRTPEPAKVVPLVNSEKR